MYKVYVVCLVCVCDVYIHITCKHMCICLYVVCMQCMSVMCTCECRVIYVVLIAWMYGIFGVCIYIYICMYGMYVYGMYECL